MPAAFDHFQLLTCLRLIHLLFLECFLECFVPFLAKSWDHFMEIFVFRTILVTCFVASIIWWLLIEWKEFLINQFFLFLALRFILRTRFWIIFFDFFQAKLLEIIRIKFKNLLLKWNWFLVQSSNIVSIKILFIFLTLAAAAAVNRSTMNYSSSFFKKYIFVYFLLAFYSSLKLIFFFLFLILDFKLVFSFLNLVNITGNLDLIQTSIHKLFYI